MFLPRLVLLLGALWALGCGGATPEPVTAPAAVEIAPPARDAHDIATRLVGAKITALIHVGRMRNHPLAPRIAKMDAWAGVFEGSGIEPLTDVDRAFLAAADARDQENAMAVIEHHVDAPKVKAALGRLVEQSGSEGRWLEGYDFPAARVKVRDRTSVVLAVTASLLVVTSDRLARSAAELSHSGGLPEPDGAEALSAEVAQPASTLKARGVPPIPKTLSHAHATVTLVDGGSADVAIDAESTDPEQARADAKALTKEIEDATTIRISIIKVRAFEPITFEAEESTVKARRRVTQGELETLLGLAQMMAK
jgi:hypothetical protein